jgi:hypothetical protein
MKPRLNDWLKNGWASAHETSPREIANLFAIADRDIAAAGHSDLVNDWRFNIAYNGALQLAPAALAAAGYRAERANHHYRVIQSLELTIGAEAATVQKFDVFRKKRNVSDYERANTISDVEVEEMRRLAESLRKDVLAWISARHATLKPPA